MRRTAKRAVERAGLGELAERALAGHGLADADLARVRAADTLVLGVLADAVRERHRGDEVRMWSEESARRERALVRLELASAGAQGPTGEELLRELALVRLRAPGTQSIAVRFDALGLELAQAALVFGADAWWGDFGARRSLPTLDASERRAEIQGLVERAGRRVVWADTQFVAAEGRS